MPVVLLHYMKFALLKTFYACDLYMTSLKQYIWLKKLLNVVTVMVMFGLHCSVVNIVSIQCIDSVGWATGRVPGL